jgi:predicted transcriptional regulator
LSGSGRISQFKARGKVRVSTILVALDDDLSANLHALCAGQGREPSVLVAELVEKYVEAERLKQSLAKPETAAFYEELANEDLALAEGGLDDYEKQLDEADQG